MALKVNLVTVNTHLDKTFDGKDKAINGLLVMH